MDTPPPGREPTPPEETGTRIDLSSDRWAEADALLDAALDRPARERSRFLDEACSDAALRRTVEELLEASETAGFFEGDPLRLAADAEAGIPATPEAGALAGCQVGPWRLERELGRGGMGVVYHARHTAHGQEAAVKLLPPTLASPRFVEQFEAEKRALAKLPHEGVAGLLDGGVGEDGAPYFAMEYVPGEPITDFCAARRMGVRARVELFIHACAAVQAAHQRLVIHRDLKPSNVFAFESAAGDTHAGGRVKLLDFGIAKVLTEGDGAVDLPVTVTAERLLTPAYAAPEQVTGAPVSTATDVYALGVLLYELLTGRRPYKLSTGSSVALAVAISEAVVVRPSVAVGRAEATGNAPADPAARAGEAGLPPPPRLARQLSGDLDAVLMKALRKEPEARYASPQALADDLRRFLEERPVAARKGRSAYRARKFVRRHRTAVALSALAGLFLIAGLSAALWQGAVAARERAEKEQEAAVAQGMFRFARNMLRALNPNEAQGAPVQWEDLVAAGLEEAEALEAWPTRQAAMLREMGQLAYEYDQFALADTLHRQALALRREAHGGTHPSIGESLFDLATTRFAERDFDEAHELYEAALRVREAALPAGDARVLESLNGLAWSYANRRAWAPADSLYGLALDRWAGPPHPEQGRALAGRADVLAQQGQIAVANALYQQALDVLSQSLSPMHPDVTDLRFELARSLEQQGRPAEAAQRYEEVLADYRRIYGDEHRNVATVQYTLGRLYEQVGDARAAEQSLRAAAETYERAVGSAHMWTAQPLVVLGRVLLGEGRPGDAEEVLQKARTVYLDAGESERSGRLAAAHRYLGLALVAQGRYAEAEPLLKASLDAYGAVGQPLYQERAQSVRDELADLYRAWGRPERTGGR